MLDQRDNAYRASDVIRTLGEPEHYSLFFCGKFETDKHSFFLRIIMPFGLLLSTTIFSSCTLKFFNGVVQVLIIELTLPHDCSRNASKRFSNLVEPSLIVTVGNK